MFEKEKETTDSDQTHKAENMATLKMKRGQIKRSLTSPKIALFSINENTDFAVLNLEQRLEIHLKLWDKFVAIQTQLEEDITDEDAIEQPDVERLSLENRFYLIAGQFRKYIKNSMPLANQASQSVSNQCQDVSPSNSEIGNPQFPIASNQAATMPATGSQSGDEDRTNEIISNEFNEEQNSTHFNARFQIPKLQAPTFHGSFDSWLTFRDSFKSMCHDNPALSSFQKFHYLKACLKDEAADVIAALEITSNNYQVAWDLLTTRYDNRKFIVESHVQALFEIPHMSKELSARALLDHVQNRIRALKALGQPVDQWDTLLIFIIREKLNNYTRKKWEESIGSTALPSLKWMISFLERRSLIESTQSAQKLKDSHWSQQPRNNHSQSRFNSRASQSCMTTTPDSSSEKSKVACILCKRMHHLYACEKFKVLTPQERYDIVRKAPICHNCLLTNHRKIDCRRGPCQKCRRRHNTLLHFSQEKPVEKDSNAKETTSKSITTAWASFQPPMQSQVILGTAIVDILDSTGQYRPCRAFLDSCSQCNSITAKFANALGLQKKEINATLKGVENLQSRIKYVTSTQIKSRYEEVDLNLSFLVFHEISELMPAIPIDKNSIRIPDQIFLADPEFFKPSEIDILIGAEHFYNLMRAGQIKVKGQSALFQETDLGWIFAGRYVSPQVPKSALQPQSRVSCNFLKFQDLPILWELGEENSSEILSEEERAAEDHYKNTTKRDESGRYVVRLPFNDKKELLGDSQNVDFQQFYALEKRFARNPELKSQYTDCIDGYFNEGHISLVNNQDLSRPGNHLPHHYNRGLFK